MKKTLMIVVGLVTLVSTQTWAATVLHYDFDTDMAGNPTVAGNLLNPTSDPALSAPDLSGNGYDMWVYRDRANAYSADTADGTGMSMELFGGEDGYVYDGGIENWSPETWTIEASVQLASPDGWATFIGRDGASNGPAADFYLQNTWDGYFRCDFATASGERVEVLADFIAVAGQWYKLAVVNDGSTVTMYCDQLDGNGYQVVGSKALTGTPADNAFPVSGFNWTFGRGWYDGNQADFLTGKLDDIRFSDTAGIPGAAYAPNPTPLNIDGTVGTLVGTDAELTLNFKAAEISDASGQIVNPDVLTHYVYLSTATDPNAIYHGSVDQVHNADPTLTDGNISYGPVTLANNTTYYWHVEEGLDDGTGNPYPAGDTNNLKSPIWSFNTVAAIPLVVAGPENTVADVNGNATFSVIGSAVTDSYRWFKVDSPADIELVDDARFSGTTTATLTITGATLADEGEYYCIAYNGTTPSDPSPTAQLWTSRMMAHWKFDGNLLDSVAQTVPGAPAHDGFTVSDDPNAVLDPSFVGIDNAISGDAIQFSDDAVYVEVPDSDYFNFYVHGFTTSLWYKPTTPYTGWRLPISKLDGGSAGWLFGIDHANPSPFFTFIIESPWSRVDGTDDIDLADGQWHLMTVTYDPTTATATLFTDGREMGQMDLDLSSAPLPAAPVNIGGWVGDGTVVNAQIDDVQMYSYALTPKQVAALYTDFVDGAFICIAGDDPLDDINKYDINQDCRVNLADFAELAATWMECRRIPLESCDW